MVSPYMVSYHRSGMFLSTAKVLLEKNATGLMLNISGSIRDRLDLQSSANWSGIRL